MKIKGNEVRTIAVGFDGTLSIGAEYPKTGKPNKAMIRWLKLQQKKGTRIILNTIRQDEDLFQAVKFLARYNLVCDAVNSNLQDVIENSGKDTRKIIADMYIDIRNRRWKLSWFCREIYESVCGNIWKDRTEQASNVAEIVFATDMFDKVDNEVDLAYKAGCLTGIAEERECRGIISSAQKRVCIDMIECKRKSRLLELRS